MQRIFALSSFGLLIGMACAAGPKPNAAMDNSTDRNFMSTLAMAGSAEIEAGQVAIMRGDRFDRRFGRQMVHDHQMAATQLMLIAQNRNVTLPSAPDRADEVIIHRMEKMSGAKFAATYHHFAMMSHREALRLFRDEIAHGNDTSLKAWARKTLPTIEKHMSEARDMSME